MGDIDANLLNDVKEFASQLGFGGGEATFDDFNPKNAQKRIAKETKKTAPKPKVQKKSIPPPVHRRSSVKSLLGRHDAGVPWWQLSAPDAMPTAAPSSFLVDAARERSKVLLDTESLAFEANASKQRGSSSLEWLQLARRGGTTSDKVGAAALLVQESCISNLKALESLLAAIKKKGGARAVVGTTLDALRELWIDVLLPDTRKLYYLDQRPLTKEFIANKQNDKKLLLWGFEDELKRHYAEFVQALESLSRDNLEFVKDRAIKTAFDLLNARPEQEAALLSLLVNKLGDPDRKLASKTGYLLSKLLTTHPGMKHVVVREVERFLFRPGLGDRPRYYAVVYLNQIVLSHRDSRQGERSLARRLIDIYFTLFKLFTEGKLGTAATLAAQQEQKRLKKAQERAVKRGKKPKEEANGGAVTGLHKGEMDARMLGALLTGVRRAFPFVSAEEIEPLIESHADSLFRLTHTCSFGLATQALLLLYQLMSSRSAVSDRFYRALYAATSAPEFSRSTKGPMFMGLLFKAIKMDVSPKRAAAFVKRLLQTAAYGPSNFACGCLVAVSEIVRVRPGLWTNILHGEEEGVDGTYDATKRDPLYTGAEQSCFWELVLLAFHSHPSAAVMARTLLAGTHVSYNGDPLRDLTLHAFLDKFVSKKPKDKPKGDSLMQPMKLANVQEEEAKRKAVLYKAALYRFESAGAEAENAMFQTFFAVKAARSSKVKRRKDEQGGVLSDQDEEGASSDEEDAFLEMEEDHGEGGIGADPDDFDVDALTMAMAEEEEEEEEVQALLDGLPDGQHSDADEDELNLFELPEATESEEENGNVFADAETLETLIAQDLLEDGAERGDVQSAQERYLHRKRGPDGTRHARKKNKKKK